MTLSAGMAPLLACLLLVTSVADAGFPGVPFPTGGGQFGARLSPRSYSEQNSYPAAPYGGPYGDVEVIHNNIGNSHNIGGNHNYGGNYNPIGSSHNIGGNYNNGGHYNNIGSNYNGDHRVYMRNNGHVAENGYSVNTANSALRAQSVQSVRSADHQDNHIGEYGDYDDGARSQYRYEVSDPRTGDAKSQQETRDGDAVTGEYRVLEPNGLMRIVSYTADDAHGFVARVRWVPAERPHGAAVSHQEVTQEQSH